MIVTYNRSFLFIALMVMLTGALQAKVRLPHLISDGMVLQRDQPIRMWGWADAGEKVTVHFDGNTQETKANKEGEWEVFFPSMKAGGPYTVEVNGENLIVLKEVYVGDVWACSGQSNMELTMARVQPMFPEEFDQEARPAIRYFDVPDAYDFSHVQTDTRGGEWIQVDKEHISQFSAVAYFFAKRLNEKYDVPIGLINASVGGSPIQSWISKEELKRFPEDFAEAEKFRNPDLIKQIEKQDRERISTWQRTVWQKDKGYAQSAAPWHSLNVQKEGWEKMERLTLLPLTDDRAVNGVYWFRKEIELYDPDVSKLPAKLLMGTMIDSDSTYVNGQLVGTTGYRYPPRRYKVPLGVLRQGKNVLTMRLINERGQGGFVEEKPYQLEVGDEVIDLKRDWHYQLGAAMPALPGQTFVRWKPLGLYQAMMAPVQEFPVKGVIWYQGESNTGNPSIYAEQMKALIIGLRNAWEREDLPFLYVQLPNFMEASESPQESNWAVLREKQRMVAMEVPHTGMAVAIDAGEANDIHPLDKKTIGDRLALQAFAVAYGEEGGPFSGPSLKSAQIKEGVIELAFETEGSGLAVADGRIPQGFALAGEGGGFHWAEARIEGEKVILSSPMVKRPKTVRYAWADNPAKANLVNAEGLPASPFEISVE
ncbi:sialate O-acetylesterase [Echinicola strongylocentroti]|uniref:Sialate O-acetylesterase n=1 Tax=Echinicola strongylocentroti TaxID=1795355 RepID=A0A2Z4IKX3_9BACT|nr:sialate O-acetylesterase [Echinicola strongylocentroti]AWW31379.1 sialate O-acetylesterase [Echinicola strongylocentroti]